MTLSEDHLSPRTCGPRTGCPPGHVVLGPDVPRQDRMSPQTCARRKAVAHSRSVKIGERREMRLSEIEYDHLYDYAAFSRYPTGFSKNQCHIIRRKCIEHFRAEDGVLYYSASKVSKSASCQDRTWKIVVRTEEERRRIIESCHSSPHGKYYDWW